MPLVSFPRKDKPSCHAQAFVNVSYAQFISPPHWHWAKSNDHTPDEMASQRRWSTRFHRTLQWIWRSITVCIFIARAILWRISGRVWEPCTPVGGNQNEENIGKWLSVTKDVDTNSSTYFSLLRVVNNDRSQYRQIQQRKREREKIYIKKYEQDSRKKTSTDINRSWQDKFTESQGSQVIFTRTTRSLYDFSLK